MVYTIVVTNNGPSDAPDSAVADTFPTPLTCSYTAVGGGGATGFTASGSGNIADPTVDFPAAGTVTYTATCTIAPSATGTVSNTATVTASVTDPASGNDSATDVDTLVPLADIALTTSVDNPTPGLGASVTLTVIATNLGPSDAAGVQVTDLLPPGLTWVSDTPSLGTYDHTTGLWTIGAIATGADATLEVHATVDRTESLFVVAAKTADSQTDPDASNNTAVVGLNAPTLADIQVQQTVDDDTPALAQNVTFTVYATNAAPASSTGVVVGDTLPAGLTFVSSSASQGTYASSTWTVGTLGSGVTAMLEIVATVDTTAPITNTATKTAGGGLDPLGANNAASVTLNDSTVADLAIGKLASQRPVANGTTFAYTLVVTNNGPATATDVEVLDDLTSIGVTVNSASSSQGTCLGAPNLTCSLGDIYSGGSALITLDVTKTVTTALVNTATVSALESDPNAANNSATDTETAASAIFANGFESGDTTGWSVAVP